MFVPNQKLAEVRPWVLFLLLGLTLATAACNSTDESCNPGPPDYEECGNPE
jgi:hypothetical protein